MHSFRGLSNRQFYAILAKPDDEFYELLAQCGLLYSKERPCVKDLCGGTMTIQTDGKFRCKDCRTRAGFRKDSFFENSRLHIKDIMELAFLWSNDELQIKNAKRNVTRDNGTTISEHTIVDWRNLFRDVCQHFFETTSMEIGGPNVEVQIDETVISKPKYHRGRVPTEDRWFFGGIDENDKDFIVSVDRRDADTLLPLIRKHILPGSIIVSDGWAAYNRIADLGYEHKVVVHLTEFVTEDGTHTNAIESVWQKLKNRHKKEFGTSRELLDSYIIQFLWQKKFPHDRFFHLLEQIAKKYPCL